MVASYQSNPGIDLAIWVKAIWRYLGDSSISSTSMDTLSPPSPVSDGLARRPPLSPTSHKNPVPIVLPPEVLNAPPLWSVCVIGHFLGNAPNIAIVHSTVNRIWNYGRSDRAVVKIDAQFISPRSVLFRIPCDTVSDYVLLRKFWHISSIPMVVQVWSPSMANAKPDMSNIPLWVDFEGVSDNVFSEEGLKLLSNQVGTYSTLHPNTARCIKLDKARTMVVVDLEKPLITQIDIEGVSVPVKVSYPWLPDQCSLCNAWGHCSKECDCPIKVLPPINVMNTGSSNAQGSSHTVPPLIGVAAPSSDASGPSSDVATTDDMPHKTQEQNEN